MAMFVFWDAFQSQSVTISATETIADMMSRETDSFDDAYIGGMHEVFDWLTSAETPTAIRITALGTTVDAEGGETFEVFWSRATDPDVAALEPEDLAARIPTPDVGEQLIVLETFSTTCRSLTSGSRPTSFTIW